MKNGDRNTTFFHRFASQRKWVNQIHELKHVDGSLISKRQEIAVIAQKNYFQHLFTTTREESSKEGLQGVNAFITEDMNKELLTSYTLEEIMNALREMSP